MAVFVSDVDKTVHATLTEIALLNERGGAAVAMTATDKSQARHFVRRGFAEPGSIGESIVLTDFGRWVIEQPYIVGKIEVDGRGSDGWSTAKMTGGLTERLYGWSDGVVTWKSTREFTIPEGVPTNG